MDYPHLPPDEPTPPPKPLLRHRINPCDIDRWPHLAPLGDWLADRSSGCPCCDTLRVPAAFALGVLLTYAALTFLQGH
jgi:hypothetical protein